MATVRVPHGLDHTPSRPPTKATAHLRNRLDSQHSALRAKIETRSRLYSDGIFVHPLLTHGVSSHRRAVRRRLRSDPHCPIPPRSATQRCQGEIIITGHAGAKHGGGLHLEAAIEDAVKPAVAAGNHTGITCR
jgi:hypothetical protein